MTIHINLGFLELWKVGHVARLRLGRLNIGKVGLRIGMLKAGS